MNLPKRNSADGRCYWMKPEVQRIPNRSFDQCIPDTVTGDTLWPPVVVSSEGTPFEVWRLLEMDQNTARDPGCGKSHRLQRKPALPVG